MKLIKIVTLIVFLSMPVFAEEDLREEPASPPPPSETQVEHPDYRFVGGFFLQSALPGTWSPQLFASSEENGFALGYGFQIGWTPLSYLTLLANLDGIFHNSDIPSTTTTDEFATAGSIGVTARVFPLGPDMPRVYALLGIALTNYWIHDSFTIIPSAGEGASFRGPRYSLGAGYEHPMDHRIKLFAEIDLCRTVLTRQTFSSAPSVSLDPSVARWAPSLRVGILVGF